MNDELKRTLDRYLELCDSEENKRRQGLWVPEPVVCRDKFRRVPRPNRETGTVPVVADPGPSMWAKIFNFNMKDYYTKPKVYLLNYLKMMIAQFELGDDTNIDRVLPFWPGISFEASLLGTNTIYHDDTDPWLGREFVINEKSDLDNLELPDFYRSGLMPIVHQFYSEINDMLEETDCSLAFPEITRSPYGVAWAVRGFENLAFDFMDDPEFVHRMMRFLNDAHIKFFEDRAKFLGEPIPAGHLYNDEVDCNVIGPKIYEQFILPYEIEMSEFHKGIRYWHSCGNVTPILQMLRTMPNLDMLNISSWTDHHKAAEICPDIALEICVKPTDDVYLADRQRVEASIGEIADSCKKSAVKAYYLRSGSLQTFADDINSDFAQIKQWITVSKEVIARKLG